MAFLIQRAYEIAGDKKLANNRRLATFLLYIAISFFIVRLGYMHQLFVIWLTN